MCQKFAIIVCMHSQSKAVSKTKFVQLDMSHSLIETKEFFSNDLKLYGK